MTQARRLEPWVSPLLLMAVIFVLSAQADLTSGLGTIDLIGRKVIHFAQYGLLAGAVASSGGQARGAAGVRHHRPLRRHRRVPPDVGGGALR